MVSAPHAHMMQPRPCFGFSPCKPRNSAQQGSANCHLTSPCSFPLRWDRRHHLESTQITAGTGTWASDFGMLVGRYSQQSALLPAGSAVHAQSQAPAPQHMPQHPQQQPAPQQAGSSAPQQQQQQPIVYRVPAPAQAATSAPQGTSQALTNAPRPAQGNQAFLQQHAQAQVEPSSCHLPCLLRIDLRHAWQRYRLLVVSISSRPRRC